MAFIIDAHEDLAYNALTFGRDYLRSVAETRRLEAGTPTPERTGQSLIGWPEYQRGQVAAVFGTLFLAPRRYGAGAWETQVFANADEARKRMEAQLAYYRRLADDHSDQFRLVYNRKDFKEVLAPWENEPAYLPRPAAPDQDPDPCKPVTHPVGIILMMEGPEGLRAPEELDDWWEMGVRIVGPVWAGTRFCGGTFQPGEFTREGMALLEIMADLGFVLDLSHMTEASALQALDRYDGPVIATHANVRALLKGIDNERHLTDRVIRKLVERDGIMGVIPFNKFLKPSWSAFDDRQDVTLKTLAAHIDHICQIAGDARHAGLGTDFDGGFGWPAVPYEINTIADLQKLAPLLGEMGYSDASISDILGNNWRSLLERTLPA